MCFYCLVLRYWWSKNTGIWLAESIFCHNWRTRFPLDMEFLQYHKEHCYALFLALKRTYQWIKYLAKAKKNLFLRNFWAFLSQNENFWNFFWKIRLCQFLTLKVTRPSCKTSEKSYEPILRKTVQKQAPEVFRKKRCS